MLYSLIEFEYVGKKSPDGYAIESVKDLVTYIVRNKNLNKKEYFLEDGVTFICKTPLTIDTFDSFLIQMLQNQNFLFQKKCKKKPLISKNQL